MKKDFLPIAFLLFLAACKKDSAQAYTCYCYDSSPLAFDTLQIAAAESRGAAETKCGEKQTYWKRTRSDARCELK